MQHAASLNSDLGKVSEWCDPWGWNWMRVRLRLWYSWSRTMHPKPPLINYLLNCAEGVWRPWYIGSDNWFQDNFWEASSLGFQRTFLTAWRVRPGEYFMIGCFIGDAFGNLSYPFCSTVLQCGVHLNSLNYWTVKSVVPVLSLGCV